MDFYTLTKPFIYTCAPGILLSILAIILNIFVINFYGKSDVTVSVVPLLYTFIASMDILSAMGSIHMYVVTLFLNKDLISYGTANVNAMIFFFFTQVCSRCSVFYNLLLALSRTIMILKPFYQINIKVVIMTCIVYAAPWIFLHVFNIQESRSEYLKHISGNGLTIGSGFAYKIGQMEGSSYPTKTFFIVSMLPDLVAFVVPVIIVIITCAIQVLSLHRSSQFPTSSNQRHVTITVLLMSTLFVLCNSPFSGSMVAMMIRVLAGIRSKISEERSYYITVISATILPVLNAALNPVIIITRSSEMRRKFIDLFQRMLRWIRVRKERFEDTGH